MHTPPLSICIIRISSMGDIVLVSPLLRILRAHFPGVRLDIAVAERFSELVENNPHISTVHTIDTTGGIRGILRQSRRIRAGVPGGNGYSVVLDLHVHIRSWLLRQRLGERTFRVDKFRRQKKNLVHHKLGIGEAIVPIAERYIRTASALGVSDDGKGLELWLPEEKELGYYPPDTLPVIVPQHPRRIAIAPGARHATKRWLPSRFAELAEAFHQKYGAEIVLLGGQDDLAVCEEVRRLSTVPMIEATGLRSIYDTVRILDSCDLLVCNDSGIMHIAAARRIKICAIFGSTVREFGFAPFRVPHVVVEKALDCRPCTHIGLQACPLGHLQCMVGVTTADVLQAAEKELLTLTSI